MFVTCSFAGCATFSINKVKYYNEVMAKVGDTEITRHELLVAYNNYGYSTFTQQGQSEQEAINSTLDILISQESLYQYALDNDSTYRPRPYQVNESINELFDSIDDNYFDKYITTAKKMLNIKSDDSADETEPAKTKYSFADYSYKKRANVVYDGTKYVVDYKVESDPDFDSVIATKSLLSNFEDSAIISEIKTAYLDKVMKSLEDEDNAQAIYNKAISLFVDNLMSYEEYLRDDQGKPYSKNTDEIITRYFARSFESQIKSLYLENLRTVYLEETEEDIDLSKLISKFNSLLNKDYTIYKDDHTSYSSKIKDIGTSGDSILYHPTLENGAEYGYFIHTLISLTEDQQSLIKDKISQIKDDTDREIAYNTIISETTVTKRTYDSKTKEYVEGDEKATLQEIITEYNKICIMPNDEARLNAFIDFMFTYTGDTGTLSQGMPYVVGTKDYSEVNKDTDDIGNDYSAMDPAFTKEAVKLMATGIVGEMSTLNGYDVVDMCITNYGVHFVMYMGNVNSFDILPESPVYIQDTNKTDDPNGDLNLFKKEINPLTGKTYFDMLFDTVYPAGSADEVYTSKNGYSDFENEIINDNLPNVTKYETRINATKSSI